ncbi:Fe(3+) ions import ATP-binding protein FbpC [Thiomonas arsenitoxydans]|uniref:ABC-type Fe3+ transport system, ATPase component n=1 Tax=Thiomonas arsenitoxydans (strain DSM 22701 / CIP 110005 / 3As) TaxID=426114 RepID=D6CPJ4_THIA3|nr:ABC transporter ATP-binding protein [Thiomonas arsenitoxydans]CAZ87924.1 putative ABC-type Fe3+ transport system, ATPase component [Thiomonas arsenitoxydans]CQR26546.1 Fe(3+) ions import ATP-binding protein FbpC [Thiomonas arsenitoxydans]CQR27269.1 Fe(3+) ions import ATP-binding protein FbpC [Thiomonas arsenitoxydans]CQR31400.1 Fe(3+) ions import ATP-binding protein FbpC [Thiomonas arsenitoxydans]CQR31420.1 Fe(3+) ions import ATP-binding protein FbpC [Thiomonas arsenitoxydans]
MTLLHIDSARKRFGGTTALHDLSLQLQEGEILCLLGPSGSGKTTLLRLVAGLERLDGGSMRLGATVIDAAGGPFLPPEQRQLGMVFQDYALWPHLSALDNVALPLHRLGRDKSREQARAMLADVGLADLADRHPHALSGGQQQRVALARALAVRPRLLLCDEPLSNLDAGLREELRDLIGSVVREHGISALYITHDHREALALADRVGVMAQGRLLQLSSPRALLRQPSTEFVAHFTGAHGPWPAQLRAGRLHAPWGEVCAPPQCKALADGPLCLYLRTTALHLPHARVNQDALLWPVQARVLSHLTVGEHTELRIDLHGVTLRLPVSDDLAPAAGSTVSLRIAAEQTLFYPTMNPTRKTTTEELT